VSLNATRCNKYDRRTFRTNEITQIAITALNRGLFYVLEKVMFVVHISVGEIIALSFIGLVLFFWGVGLVIDSTKAKFNSWFKGKK